MCTKIRGTYYEKRELLHKWVKKECVKLSLNIQTFANVIFLMDRYYKYNEFDKSNFLRYALCIITISTKALQTKVLFTGSIAKINKFDLDQTIQTELKLLSIYNFRVNSFNFFAFALEYMQRWDSEMQKCQAIKQKFFLKETLQSYQIYLSILYFCQRCVTVNRHILQQDLQVIFHFVLQNQSSNQQYIKQKIQSIFKDPILKAGKQQEYSYQYENKITEQQLLMKLKVWKKQFEEMLPSISKRYEKRGDYKTYGQFISLLF